MLGSGQIERVSLWHSRNPVGRLVVALAEEDKPPAASTFGLGDCGVADFNIRAVHTALKMTADRLGITLRDAAGPG